MAVQELSGTGHFIPLSSGLGINLSIFLHAEIEVWGRRQKI